MKFQGESFGKVFYTVIIREAISKKQPLGKKLPKSDATVIIKDENAELRADVKFLMQQNSDIVERMERMPINGNNEQPTQTSLSTTNSQRILTPEISSLITSVNELALKNFETGLKLGRDPENDNGMDKSLDFGQY